MRWVFVHIFYDTGLKAWYRVYGMSFSAFISFVNIAVVIIDSATVIIPKIRYAWTIFDVIDGISI